MSSLLRQGIVIGDIAGRRLSLPRAPCCSNESCQTRLIRDLCYPKPCEGFRPLPASRNFATLSMTCTVWSGEWGITPQHARGHLYRSAEAKTTLSWASSGLTWHRMLEWNPL